MTSYRYDFGVTAPVEGWQKVKPDTVYSLAAGYGFEEAGVVSGCERQEESTPLVRDFCIPFESVFAADVDNGTYIATVIIGDAVAATHTTIKAGTGRLVRQGIRTVAGQYSRETFAVRIENQQFRLAFSGLAPRINALELRRSEEPFTIYIAGDSTVTDQPADGYPYAGWGQMLGAALKADAAISNHAISGRSSKSFIGEGRLQTILAELRASDMLLIQFGHNDQKLDEPRRTEPFTTYKEHLMAYIDGARSRGALPILVTPVHRRYYDGDQLVDTHGDYIVAMKELAEEEGVLLVDLAAKSKALFEQLGPEGTKSVFMWGAPGEFLNFPGGVADNTHFQERGAIALAQLVAEGLKELRIPGLLVALR
ncbi:lysophospholipase L1-like esterase [Paenibacillus phyllosphaerae]|uniref:Lysophospholipase L1-like esterase n=1 Tax=Paenibacillus phyllosphaerae TaxID=274593 RepID=A0A7W5FM22_9BACL|nr:rhamnogalacturonan acetylesterase [Paenibacillus phyllosphaerae]MBB3109811.1 lysophospholipase L1-like esterase [Paenibacillus phyllosphaerae]